MFKSFIYAVAFFMVIIISLSYAVSASAQTGYTCANRNEMVSTLTDKYNEHQIGVGIGKDNRLVELWVNNETGTFSILKTYANGIACVLVVGENWVSSFVMGDPA